MSAGHVLPLPEPVSCIACGYLADGGTCPASIECPRCYAGPGQRCRLPNGHAAPVLHRDRVERARRIDRGEAS